MLIHNPLRTASAAHLLCLLLAVAPLSATAADDDCDIQFGGDVMALAMSPDGTKLAVWSAEDDMYDVLSLWDLTTGTSRSEKVPTHGFPRVSFSTDGNRVAVFGSPFRIIDFKTGKEVASGARMELLRQSGDIMAVEEDQKKAKAAVRVYDMQAMKQLYDFGPVYDADDLVQLSPDGTVAGAAKGKTLTVVDLATGTARPELVLSDEIIGFGIGEQGRVIVVATKNSWNYEVYDWKNPARPPRLRSRITVAEQINKLHGRSLLHGIQVLDDQSIAVNIGRQLRIQDADSDECLDLGPCFNSPGFDARIVGTELINLETVGYRFDHQARKLHPYYEPGARAKAKDTDKGVRLVHSAQCDRFAHVSSLNTVSVRRPTFPEELLSQTSTITPAARYHPNSTMVSWDRALLSDDGAWCCTNLNSYDSNQYLGIFETATAQYTPIHHARPGAGKIADADWGLGMSCAPVHYFDPEKRTLNILCIDSRKGGKGLFNAWLSVAATSGKFEKVPQRFEAWLSSDSNTEASSVFAYDEKRLAVVVRTCPAKSNGMPDESKRHLGVLEIPSGKLIRMLAEDLPVPMFSTVQQQMGVQIDGSRRRVAVLDAEGQIRVWDVHTGDEVRCLARMESTDRFCFALDGRRLCVIKSDANDADTIEFTDLENGEHVPSIMAGTFPKTEVKAIAPDVPRYLATSFTGRMEWRNLDDGSLISDADPRADDIMTATFSADGSTLATLESHATVTFWKVPEPLPIQPATVKVLKLTR